MKKSLIFLTVLLLSHIAMAQNREITGTIVAFNKYPLKNVTVLARKSKAEVRTDEHGRFAIEVKNKDVLQIDAKTFERYVHRLGESDRSLRINLIYENKKKNFDIAVQEGYLKAEDLDYSLTYLLVENNIYGNFTDVFEAIRYAIPAASFYMEGNVQKVKLRGTKSMNQSTAALYVVNDFLTDDISYIIPNEIVSIEELHGPAAGRWGTGSGNGVISITLK
jgi:hypothetical protein